MNDFATAVAAKIRPPLGAWPYKLPLLMAASRCAVKRTDNPSEFYVASRSRRDHWWPVKLDIEVYSMCQCEHHTLQGAQCAHILAARLAAGDMPLIQALGDALLRAENNLKEHTRHTRRTRTW